MGNMCMAVRLMPASCQPHRVTRDVLDRRASLFVFKGGAHEETLRP
jgi:hypothetical protein